MYQVARPNHIDHNLCPVNILFAGSILNNEKSQKEGRRKEERRGKGRREKETSAGTWHLGAYTVCCTMQGGHHSHRFQY